MGGKRRAPPSGSAKGKAAAIGDGAVAQGGAARNISAERTRVAPSEDTLHRVLSFLLDHVGPVPLLELEGATLCSQVCKMWRRELEARGFCSRTVQLCSALAESGNAERLWQIAQRRVDACPRHAKAAFHRDATGFLDNVLEWEGSLHECLQAASQEPDASLLSRGAASTAECLGLLLVRWVGKPPGGDADEASGHSGGLGGVPSVAVSSDGKRVVSGSDDQLVKIWDVETGAEMLSLGGHTGEGICLCTVDENGDLELDAETGETIVHPGCPVPGHSCEVFSVAFSSDGTRVVSGSVDGLVKIWDAATGAEVCTLAGHKGRVYYVAFCRDGKRVVTSSEDGLVKIWNAETGAEVCSLVERAGGIWSAAVSSDGTRVVTGSAADVKIWNAETGAEVCTLEGHTGIVFAVSFSSDGKLVVSGSDDLFVKIWNAETGAEILSLGEHNGEGICLCTVDSDGFLDYDDDIHPGCPVIGHTDSVSQVKFTDDGAHVVSAGDEVRVWDVASGRQVRQLSGGMFALVEGGFDARKSKMVRHVLTAYEDVLLIHKVSKEQPPAGDGAAAPVACFKAPQTITSIQCRGAVICVACQGGAVCILSAPFLAA